jgi:uncharacterized protein (TIGR02246 family)
MHVMRQLVSTSILNLVVAAVLLVGGASTALASDADMLREIRDRNEIQALMWRYVRALDTFDADAYAAVYTPDGQFGSGANAQKGRDALKKMVSGLKQGREERAAKGEKVPPMHHMITNYHVEFVDKDHARYHAYWLTVFGTTGTPDSTPRVAAEGRSVDELVRVDGKWLIKSRDVAPKD